MMKIGSKWFSQESNCEDNTRTPRISSNSLGLESFWGLFLIAGAAAILALIIFVASFLYKHRHVLEQPDSRTSSRWRRVRAMIQIFNEKDLNSHTFKSRQQEEGIAGVGEEVKASPNRNWPESPFSYANDTDKIFGFYEGQQTSSTLSHASPETVHWAYYHYSRNAWSSCNRSRRKQLTGSVK